VSIMLTDEGHLSPSGVWVAADFRSNLIIDRYDPVFADMRASKLRHLRSVNSEDAITWNVFRSLRQIAPNVWIPLLWSRAFDRVPVPADLNACVVLWRSVPPPLGLLAGGDEGDSEIDVVIESPTWVWFLEAKHRSDISTGTTTRPDRDQVLRNLDVGTHYAGVRQFFFSLLVSSDSRSPLGVQRVREYADLAVPRERLRSHRPDGLQNLGGVSELTWRALGDVLAEASASAPRHDERAYATRALTWLRERGVAPLAV
jgi:hypothetical protein